jgi:hypothetical protein
VWADQPDDLASPLHYEVQLLADDDPDATPPTRRQPSPGLSKVRRDVLAALRAGGAYQSPAQLHARLEQTAGEPEQAPTLRAVQKALKELEEAGLAQASEHVKGKGRYWSPVATNPDAPSEEDRAARRDRS